MPPVSCCHHLVEARHLEVAPWQKLRRFVDCCGGCFRLSMPCPYHAFNILSWPPTLGMMLRRNTGAKKENISLLATHPVSSTHADHAIAAISVVVITTTVSSVLHFLFIALSGGLVVMADANAGLKPNRTWSRTGHRLYNCGGTSHGTKRWMCHSPVQCSAVQCSPAQCTTPGQARTSRHEDTRMDSSQKLNSSPSRT